MAQKAAKTQASRNNATLKRTHMISAIVNILFLFLHFLFNRPASLFRYILFSTPALVLEFYLERLGRPKYTEDGALVRAGEDLDAKGLTEYMWDVVYWTWLCLGACCAFGDRAWWLYVAVPVYSLYAAWKAVTGVREGFAGMGGADNAEAIPAESKRQKKLEKRGGQRVQYR
ncbi:hypothetical protein UCRPC4_g01799 [Phaeomoniella chlamydospora]|uniref:Duf788 domain-containing protein n=1 Tax=Phaeomoniella chlamydospora TaxID=158046 RepID=A0A0G2HAD1_PHACM|nr:hypothetical protein UCRPC4_g01799 [Phaeomoniella chlamydospora]